MGAGHTRSSSAGTGGATDAATRELARSSWLGLHRDRLPPGAAAGPALRARPPRRRRPAEKNAAQVPSDDTIGAPSGFCGCAQRRRTRCSRAGSSPRAGSRPRCTPGARACGCRRRRTSSPRRTARTPAAAGSPTPGSRRCRATSGDRPRTPWNTVSCASWLPSRLTARAYWFSTSCAALLQLPDRHQDPLQQVERLEAGDHDGHPVLRGDRLVLGPAHDRADVARRPGTPAPGCRATPAAPIMAGGTSTCDTSTLKLSTPRRAACAHGHRVGGRRRLEADREEHDLLVRVGRAMLTASSGE